MIKNHKSVQDITWMGDTTLMNSSCAANNFAQFCWSGLSGRDLKG